LRNTGIHSKEEDWSHILRCEGGEIWRDQIVNKRFGNVDAEIGTRDSQ
jgi:hypothetical protein